MKVYHLVQKSSLGVTFHRSWSHTIRSMPKKVIVLIVYDCQLRVTDPLCYMCPYNYRNNMQTKEGSFTCPLPLFEWQILGKSTRRRFISHFR